MKSLLPAAVLAVVVFAGLCTPIPLFAHPVPIADARLEADGDDFVLTVRCDVPALVMAAPPGHLEGDLEQEFRELPDDELQARVNDARRAFEQRLELLFDGQRVTPVETYLPDVSALRTSKTRDQAEILEIRCLGKIPPGTHGLCIRFPEDLGRVSFHVTAGGETVDRGLLEGGALSRSFRFSGADAALAADQRGVNRPRTFAEYLLLGFEHIIPEGLDHILFVLGLFLLNPHLKPLLWQVSAFTVAHSLTLALAMLGIVSLPARVVEPLIALSIALIAIENVLTPKLQPWRVAIVFGLGLLHGLGFAGVLEELGLPPHEFGTALVGFNLGVEIGQLAVILLAFSVVGWFRNRPWFRRRLVIPLSLGLAAMGLYCTIERLIDAISR